MVCKKQSGCQGLAANFPKLCQALSDQEVKALALKASFLKEKKIKPQKQTNNFFLKVIKKKRNKTNLCFVFKVTLSLAEGKPSSSCPHGKGAERKSCSPRAAETPVAIPATGPFPTWTPRGAGPAGAPDRGTTPRQKAAPAKNHGSWEGLEDTFAGIY